MSQRSDQELNQEDLLQLNPVELIEDTNKRLKVIRKQRLKSSLYWNDPVAFINDYIDWDRAKLKSGRRLTTYQEEILTELPIKKRISVRSPHGAGKTTVAAFAVLWYANTREGDDWKALTTASVFRQLEKFLWPEIHKWARLLRWDKLGRDYPYDSKLELQTRTLKLETGEAFALSAAHPEDLEGAHADHLLYVFDESKMIPAETWDAIEGAFSGTGETFVLSISTPGPPVGRFYEIQSKTDNPDDPYRDWWVKHVTLQETIENGRVDAGWAADRKNQWGAEDSRYLNRVLGEFADNAGEVVIPLAWVKAAQERHVEWQKQVQEGLFPKYGKLTSIGVDFGGTGADPNTYALRRQDVLIEVRSDDEKDSMHPVKITKKLLDRYGGVAVVDVIGVGAGPYYRLRELNCNVLPFNASASTNATDPSGELGFINMRAAAWWNMRELLDPINGYDICLPLDEELTQDLTTPLRVEKDTGDVAVESKKDIKKRLGRSTDKADAVIQAFALDVIDNQYGDYEVWGGAVSDRQSDEMTKASEEEDALLQRKAIHEALREIIENEGAYFPPGDYL